MRTFPLAALAVVLSLPTLGIAAQTTAPRQVDWQGLRELAEGKRATVRLADGSALEARRLGFDGGSAVLDDRRVGCADIASVATQRKSRRVMWSLLGAAGGAAAGAILSTRFSNEGNDAAAAWVIVGLAGAGAGAGALAGGSPGLLELRLRPDACAGLQ